LGAARPALAGLLVGLGFATRPPWLGVPLFLFEAVRAVGGVPALRTVEGRRAFARKMLRFATPIAVIGAALCWHNYARFQNPFEFGHKFLAVQWQDGISMSALFTSPSLSRNLAAALILLPRIMGHWPYIKISQHGMSLLVTSPNLAYTVLP